MTRLNLPAEGGCRCGRVRLRITARPLLTMACHCNGCQKMTGSAYSLTAAIPLEGFAIIAGETVIGGMHGSLQHHFCAWCMTWMYSLSGRRRSVNLRPTMLDEPTWFTPFIENCVEEKLPFAATPARYSFPAFPSPEEYERLLAEYAASGELNP